MERMLIWAPHSQFTGLGAAQGRHLELHSWCTGAPSRSYIYIYIYIYILYIWLIYIYIYYTYIYIYDWYIYISIIYIYRCLYQLWNTEIMTVFANYNKHRSILRRVNLPSPLCKFWFPGMNLCHRRSLGCWITFTQQNAWTWLIYILFYHIQPCEIIVFPYFSFPIFFPIKSCFSHSFPLLSRRNPINNHSLSNRPGVGCAARGNVKCRLSSDMNGIWMGY